MKPKIKFPYRAYKREFYPIIDILMKGPSGLFETEAYIDTGASVSIFLASIASDLGIDYKRGTLTHIMVGDGGFIPVYTHVIPLKIGHINFKAKIGFSASLGADFNLLGHKDIFDRFIINFDKRNKTITFQPY